MTGPCDDLRVIDLSSGPAGGLATMVLADFGADVIKVERPGGDPFRRLAAAPMWLRGKRSVTLDLKTAEDVARLHELVRGADVVVASFRPGQTERLGAGYETLAALNPRLVYASITGFGPRGPYAHYPGYEGLAAAKSGRMQSFIGQPQREGPAYAAVQVGTHSASQAAVHGILAALLVRDRTGRGQLVETSLLQGMLPYDTHGLLRTQLASVDPVNFGVDPLDDAARTPTLHYHPVMAKDGRWIQLGNLLEHLFTAYIAAIDLTEILADPRFEGAPTAMDADAREELRDRMLTRMQERTADEWMRIFSENGNVAAEPVLSTQEALENVDLIANADVVEREHPRLGAMRQLGLVARLTGTPGTVGGAEPLPGEHTAEVLAEAQPGSKEATAAASSPRHPLEGVTVVEFATVIAAPFGASLLADLGARVIKVEAVGGDPYRGMSLGTGAVKTNAGKESIALNMKTPEGLEIARKLVERADVLIHNYRPGVPERLGIGYEDAKTLSPGIVYVSANGYGPDGPSAHRPSSHPIPGALLGGVLWQSGAGMPAPSATLEEVRETARQFFRANEVNPDPNTSMVIATAALLGLYARRRTRQGQQIFVNMMGANAYANADDFLSYEGKPHRPLVDRDLYGLGALYRLYPARSGWVFLAVGTEREWATLCAAPGFEAVANDSRFATAEGRRGHDGALADALCAVFASRDADEWEQTLTSKGVGCVRADASMPGVFWLHDEQVRENEFVRPAVSTRWREYLRHGPLVTFSATPGRYDGGCLAGEHNEALLRELGYGDEQYARLLEQGVIWSEAVNAVPTGPTRLA